MQADPFLEPINKAVDGGISITTFAADSPKSKRTAYITSDNVAEAKLLPMRSSMFSGKRVNMPSSKIPE